MVIAKKSLGQNYLIDANVIKKIIYLYNIKNKNIIEIGPGKGALTDQIIGLNPKTLILIEKDNNHYNKLRIKYNNLKNIKIFNTDVLNFDFDKLIKDKSIIFGNLPYNISSQILTKLIKMKKWPPKYTDLILMFQKEVANKIVGKFNTSDYGRLSILCNFRLKVLSKFDISPNCFFPKPKIISTVLHLKPKTKLTHKIKDLQNLEKITRIIFSGKRKMINKNIKKIFGNEKLLLDKGLNLKLRPSNLRPEKYYELTELFENN